MSDLRNNFIRKFSGDDGFYKISDHLPFKIRERYVKFNDNQG